MRIVQQEKKIKTINPPVYIGRDVSKKLNEWYFYAVKDGVGRIVRFVTYPYWARGCEVPDKLDIGTSPPSEVVQETLLFIEGKVSYDHKQVGKGKRTKLVRSIPPTGGINVSIGRTGVSEGSVSGSNPGVGLVISGVTPTRPVKRRRRKLSGTNDTGIFSEKHDDVKEVLVSVKVESLEKPKRKGRSPKSLT